MYVDIVISNAFNLNKHFSLFFLFLDDWSGERWLGEVDSDGDCARKVARRSQFRRVIVRGRWLGEVDSDG